MVFCGVWAVWLTPGEFERLFVCLRCRCATLFTFLFASPTNLALQRTIHSLILFELIPRSLRMQQQWLSLCLVVLLISSSCFAEKSSSLRGALDDGEYVLSSWLLLQGSSILSLSTLSLRLGIWLTCSPLGKELPQEEEEEVILQPFQILYETLDDNTDALTSPLADRKAQMTLLTITRQHASQCLPEASSKLSLYLTVRSKAVTLFRNGTRIAFSGHATATVDTSLTSILLSRAVYSCFMDTNATAYQRKLQQSQLKWWSLQQVTLQTATGETMNEDTMQQQLQPPVSSDRSMHEAGSLVLVLVAILVPIAVLILAVIFYCTKRLRLATKTTMRGRGKEPTSSNSTNEDDSVAGLAVAAQ